MSVTQESMRQHAKGECNSDSKERGKQHLTMCMTLTSEWVAIHEVREAIKIKWDNAFSNKFSYDSLQRVAATQSLVWLPLAKGVNVIQT